ncbi:MAG: ATP-binding protein [Candidatus Zipacnadales bacterium]
MQTLEPPPEMSNGAADEYLIAQRNLALKLLEVETTQQALKLCLDTAIQFSGLELGGIYVVDDQTGDFILTAHWGLSKWFVEAVKRLEADSLRLAFIAEKKPIYLDTTTITKVEEYGVLEEGLQALAILPIVHHDRIIACLNIASRCYDSVPARSRYVLEMVAGMAGNVLARLRAQEALRESEARYRALVESATDSIFVVGPDGIFLFVNRTAAQALGRTPAEIQGRHMAELFPAEIAERQLQVIQQVFYTGQPQSTLYAPTVTIEGERIYNTSLTPVMEDSGQVAYVLGVTRDVTKLLEAEEKQRRAEARLRQAQKLESLGLFAGGIAHDLGSLLTGVIGNVVFARNKLDPDSPSRPYLDLIEKAALQANHLVEEMFAYSGRAPHVWQTVDLSQEAQEVYTLMAAEVPSGVHLEWAVAEDLPHVAGSATQLREVLLNLITNALDAIRGMGGTVSVQLDGLKLTEQQLATIDAFSELPPGHYVRLRVRDDGPGMDEQTRERIFDPFFSTKPTGRGLGLAMVLGIVRGHGGAIAVDSAPGRGTTFEVLLPSAEAVRFTEPPLKEASNPADWHGEGTILVVDDGVWVREVARESLEQAGFTVVTARTVEEAITSLRVDPHRFLALVLDLTMPDGNGIDVFQEARRLHPHIPIVLASGWTEEETLAYLRTQHKTRFVRKPYQPQHLLDALREVLSA